MLLKNKKCRNLWSGRRHRRCRRRGLRARRGEGFLGRSRYRKIDALAKEIRAAGGVIETAEVDALDDQAVANAVADQAVANLTCGAVVH